MIERETDPDDPEIIRDPPVPSVGNSSEGQNVAAPSTVPVSQPHRPVRYYIDIVGQGEDTDANRAISASLGAAGVTAPPSSAAWTPPGAPPAPPIHAAPGAVHRQVGAALSFPSALPVFETAGPYSWNCRNAGPTTPVEGNRPAGPSNAAAWSPPAPPVHGTSGPPTVCCGCPSAAANAPTPCHGLPSAERFPASAAGSPFFRYPGPFTQHYGNGEPSSSWSPFAGSVSAGGPLKTSSRQRSNSMLPWEFQGYNINAPPGVPMGMLWGNLDWNAMLPPRGRGRPTKFQESVRQATQEAMYRYLAMQSHGNNGHINCSTNTLLPQQQSPAHPQSALLSFCAPPYQGPTTSMIAQYQQASQQEGPDSSIKPSHVTQSHLQGPASSSRDNFVQDEPGQYMLGRRGPPACVLCYRHVAELKLKFMHHICKTRLDEWYVKCKACPDVYCQMPFLPSDVSRTIPSSI